MFDHCAHSNRWQKWANADNYPQKINCYFVRDLGTIFRDSNFARSAASFPHLRFLITYTVAEAEVLPSEAYHFRTRNMTNMPSVESSLGYSTDGRTVKWEILERLYSKHQKSRIRLMEQRFPGKPPITQQHVTYFHGYFYFSLCRILFPLSTLKVFLKV